MSWLNTKQKWGYVTIVIHWLTAMTVVFLFSLGLWMVELTYYDSWYQSAPHIHKSIGLLLFFSTLLRLLWLNFNVKPVPLKNQSKIEHHLSKIVHWSLYGLLLSLMISGYLISTADGRSIEVFNWFELPAVLSTIKGQEDIAGNIHYILAITLIIVVVLHACAA
ncbi:MAG: cytochrome b, partial [Pseudomonadota bacterium]